MSKAPRATEERKDARTSAEEMQMMRKLVRWTLWRMATDVVEVRDVGRKDAEDLFRNSDWVAKTIGRFVSNHYSEDDTVEWAAFVALLEEK